ncbi:hypothetical protein BIW11_02533 [Tropilaelaps mercedesae]|uniref:Uncharacterized protein n=1 Tax=Tropilaelaps mercedesae TaxID=418985 RepID=A0A1V9Y1Y0_9ACAR|nr:hypothetical protein BIW11_02533 [Tropilaelaps mercedesae]
MGVARLHWRPGLPVSRIQLSVASAGSTRKPHASSGGYSQWRRVATKLGVNITLAVWLEIRPRGVSELIRLAEDAVDETGVPLSPPLKQGNVFCHHHLNSQTHPSYVSPHVSCGH